MNADATPPIDFSGLQDEATVKLIERTQKIFSDFAETQLNSDGYDVPSPQVVMGAYSQFWAKAMENPAPLAQAQQTYWTSMAKLWTSHAAKMSGQEDPIEGPIVTPNSDDRRFKDDAWDSNPFFQLVRDSYLLTAQTIEESVDLVDNLPEDVEKKVRFYTRTMLNSLSPTNAAFTNPEVMRATLESGGENLRKGFDNFLRDLENGKGRLKIAMVDEEAFEVGKNIATTPGKVVFQNKLMQLIQYTPTTETAHKTPLLVVPPWINKFYILDLREKNSLIKWLVDQGHTVFVISWVNPSAALADVHFSDYMTQGPIAAIDAIQDATGEDGVNIIGYCIGGTLTSTTMAYMYANGDERIKSATLLTTMLDFSEPGELGVFIDDEQLTLMEEHMSRTGTLEARYMSSVFNMLKDKDLIWSFAINNYLLGKDPAPFDLLYWNSDSTGMPALMQSFYLREMYQANNLVKSGAIELLGTKIDLKNVTCPVYHLSTKDDHIAPWTSTYAGTKLFGGPVKFVLAGSGHIAGVINPPSAGKYAYWTNSRKPVDPTRWFEGSKKTDGSWWPDWQKWVTKTAGKQVPAREPGDGKLKVLEAAPGSYVKVKAEY